MSMTWRTQGSKSSILSSEVKLQWARGSYSECKGDTLHNYGTGARTRETFRCRRFRARLRGRRNGGARPSCANRHFIGIVGNEDLRTISVPFREGPSLRRRGHTVAIGGLHNLGERASRPFERARCPFTYLFPLWFCKNLQCRSRAGRGNVLVARTVEMAAHGVTSPWRASLFSFDLPPLTWYHGWRFHGEL